MIHVAYEDERRIEVWTIDRPRAANAIDRATFASFEAAVEAASARVAAGEALRGIVLAAASTSPPPGKREVFLSGADLREVEAITDEATARTFAGSMMTLLSRLERLPALVVAAISGDVYGGGCEIVTACDLRIAEEGIQLAFRQTRIGVSSGWGGMTRLVRLLGLGGIKRLLLTGLPCEAAEALQIGLVDEVVPRGGSLARALAIVRAASEGAPSAFAAMKRGLLECYELDREASYARELERFLETWRSPEHREALAALREKRKPSWG